MEVRPQTTILKTSSWQKLNSRQRMATRNKTVRNLWIRRRTNARQDTSTTTTWLTQVLMQIRRPCLNCKTLTTNATRCTPCQTIWNKHHPKPDRPHYKGDYKKRAKQIRDNAIACWICGEGKRANDPFTADHLIPADINSPLAAAHRSCNSRRQNKPIISN